MDRTHKTQPGVALVLLFLILALVSCAQVRISDAQAGTEYSATVLGGRGEARFPDGAGFTYDNDESVDRVASAVVWIRGLAAVENVLADWFANDAAKIAAEQATGQASIAADQAKALAEIEAGTQALEIEAATSALETVSP